jgi:hypothetical protein
MNFSSANNCIQLSNPGEAVVDDSFLGCTSLHIDQHDLSFHENQQLHRESAIANLNILVQRRKSLLFTTGSALNLHKSCWHLMEWKWTNGKARQEAPAPSSENLFLTAGTQMSNPIPLP